MPFMRSPQLKFPGIEYSLLESTVQACLNCKWVPKKIFRRNPKHPPNSKPESIWGDMLASIYSVLNFSFQMWDDTGKSPHERNWSSNPWRGLMMIAAANLLSIVLGPCTMSRFPKAPPLHLEESHQWDVGEELFQLGLRHSWGCER